MPNIRQCTAICKLWVFDKDHHALMITPSPTTLLNSATGTPYDLLTFSATPSGDTENMRRDFGKNLIVDAKRIVKNDLHIGSSEIMEFNILNQSFV
jgi:hypothetical protein